MKLFWKINEKNLSKEIQTALWFTKKKMEGEPQNIIMGDKQNYWKDNYGGIPITYSKDVEYNNIVIEYKDKRGE